MATSTIDSESTSRSSVNDLASTTSSGATSATSCRISASPVRISSGEAGTGWFLSCQELSGCNDDLTGVGEAGAETEQQHRSPRRDLAPFHHLGQRERNRRRGRVARNLDVARHDRVRRAELLGERL